MADATAVAVVIGIAIDMAIPFLVNVQYTLVGDVNAQCLERTHQTSRSTVNGMNDISDDWYAHPEIRLLSVSSCQCFNYTPVALPPPAQNNPAGLLSPHELQ